MKSMWLEMLGGECRFYDANGLRTRVLEAGSGDPLILLHGSGGHAESYIRNVIPLSEYFHVYSLDMLGHGFTDKPEVDYSPLDYVNHLVAFMDSAGLSQAHILGESLGGWIAAWAHLLHPDRVAKLVLVTCAGLHIPTDKESAEHEKTGYADFRRLTQEFLNHPTKGNLHNRLAWLFYSPNSVTEELVETRFAIYQMTKTQKALRIIAEGRAGPQSEKYGLDSEKLRKIVCPTFVPWTIILSKRWP